MYFFETLDLSSPNGPLKKGLYLYRRQFFSLHGIAQRHCDQENIVAAHKVVTHLTLGNTIIKH